MEETVLSTKYAEMAMRLQKAINLLDVANHLLKGFIKWHGITNERLLKIIAGIDEFVKGGVFGNESGEV